jgi:hypothetical protein
MPLPRMKRVEMARTTTQGRMKRTSGASARQRKKARQRSGDGGGYTQRMGQTRVPGQDERRQQHQEREEEDVGHLSSAVSGDQGGLLSSPVARLG